jgi:hypothetical protein
MNASENPYFEQGGQETSNNSVGIIIGDESEKLGLEENDEAHRNLN